MSDFGQAVKRNYRREAGSGQGQVVTHRPVHLQRAALPHAGGDGRTVVPLTGGECLTYKPGTRVFLPSLRPHPAAPGTERRLPPPAPATALGAPYDPTAAGRGTNDRVTRDEEGAT